MATIDVEKTVTMFEKRECPIGCGHTHFWHPAIEFGRCTEKECTCKIAGSLKAKGSSMPSMAGTKAAKRRNSPVVIHWYDKIVPLLKSGANRLLLVGPPGTGKSKTSALLTGTDYRVTMTEGTGVEDLIGMYQLKDGATVWVDGPAVMAMREGKGLLIDEIDHSPQEIGSLQYALLDDSPQLMLPTGEVVKAAPGYVVLATTNANISVLPEAIIDRFEGVLLAVTPHPDAMSDMSKAEAAAVSNYYRSLETKPYEWSGRPTLRRMRAYAKFAKAKLLSDSILAEAVFGKAGDEVLSTLVTSGI